jgi:hypothetical protein
MPALTAASWTTTVRSRRIFPHRKRNAVTLVVGNGTDTYPAGGIPMPVFQSFGFARFLETLDFLDNSSADGFLYKYDEVNNKIRIYQGDNTNAAAAPNIELGAVAVPTKTFRAFAWGW